MRITHCVPVQSVRAKVLALAAARGIPAHEDGICIHFALEDWNKVLEVSNMLKAARGSNLVLDPEM